MKTSEEEQPQPELCPVCGSVMVTEAGQTYCPKCSSEIDWGLEAEDDDAV